MTGRFQSFFAGGLMNSASAAPPSRNAPATVKEVSKLPFTAWGVGGFVLSRLQQMLTVAAKGSFETSFTVAGAFLLGGAALALFIRPPVKKL